MVKTVRNNYKGFTSDEIKRDDAACKELERLDNPTMENFEKMVRANQIQKCPNTYKYITNAKVIFGPPLEGIRVNTEICTHKRVDSDRVAIPREFQLFHKSVTLVADVLFLNGIPFLIKLSRKISFVTAENM